ncbi:MAG: NAD-dependent epimerase/dehydratase family protein, partial [Oscillospiraceae bacterium]|nr:NAD-dependent epimerase/dehydratase family protein [Oscillospiraceae bacterium]
LVTGGTVFASRFTAEYFAKEHEVYVLNRNSRPQSAGVTLINADRHALGDTLKCYEFDAVIDITAYNEIDVRDLLNALGEFKNYILISSSAVYPETLPQPFKEDMQVGANSLWGDYGTNKIAAEKYLTERVPNVYIIRPPYLYGKMNNLYREAFVFECAERDMPFYVPNGGTMPLQFFDIEDMCRFIAILLEKQPERRVFNVGNPETVTVREWARLCYKVLGKEPEIVNVLFRINQREYFPFYDYGYKLDVSAMIELMLDVKPLEIGLAQSYEWFSKNRDEIRRKPLFDYIENNLRS